jgi:hypothetical protein
VVNNRDDTSNETGPKKRRGLFSGLRARQAAAPGAQRALAAAGSVGVALASVGAVVGWAATSFS